jgi:S-adenosylmethionine synthetase, C-terminal domain
MCGTTCSIALSINWLGCAAGMLQPGLRLVVTNEEPICLDHAGAWYAFVGLALLAQSKQGSFDLGQRVLTIPSREPRFFFPLWAGNETLKRNTPF